LIALLLTRLQHLTGRLLLLLLALHDLL